MFVRVFNWCWAVVLVYCCTAVPLWAAAQEEAPTGDEPQIWVISYAILVAFLALSLFILLRPTKRLDSAFSYDELQAQKEEEMKKIKGGH
jgi:TRAP-type C4-dicarboxylate transport system permease small subunit